MLNILGTVLLGIVIFSLLLYYLIKKARNDRAVRNDLLAFSYLIINLGPNISAFGIIELITANELKEKLFLCMFIILGILIMLLGRKIRNILYEITKNKKKRNLMTNVALGVKDD
ncbi:hypothetical protein CP985_10890 [Malaciobacter mytili LMG 24559]|uniref:Uncharacterized protein n=1 Tax=Malaciobacter mytili LMG 24559 TaxID=1032238 RepID=A0AAX2AE63_9BACT|nr:hypothetical protein [Malaciobacter mytili]AXH16303.1 putative membrane protein [Malaciobacter mytili LMG 24559]RXK14969.1 hypothetical protein CP985_10890 [Malaciobacter mytili LMG 24559]